MENIPIAVFFVASVLLIIISIEIGFRSGKLVHSRSEEEKESPVSAISGAILGLLAFILAFAFSLVSERYDTRRTLVREEASAARTAWLRADFLPEADRGDAKKTIERYIQTRLSAVSAGDMQQVSAVIGDAVGIQHKMWEVAVLNARKDMNSDVAALYIESLNDLFNLHATRVSIGVYTKMPTVIWLVLYTLIVLGMFGVGYQTAIAGSRRSWEKLVLAVSFALVLTMISALDRPTNPYLPVPQKPLADFLEFVHADAQAPAVK